METSNILKLVLFAFFTTLGSFPTNVQGTTTSEVQTSDEGFRLHSTNVTAGERRILKGKGRPRKPAQPRQGVQGPAMDSAVVSKSGQGFRTIGEALINAAARRIPGRRFTLYIKAGEYFENLFIRQPDITFAGDGMKRTYIIGSKSHIDKKGHTWDSATVVVGADGFFAKDLTIENRATLGQAPALTGVARAVFWRVGLEGFQDTLFADKGVQFFSQCEISGSIDFICGQEAVAIIQNSTIYVKPPKPGAHEAFIAVSGRSTKESKGVLVLHKNVIKEKAPLGRASVYLGRPWREYAQAIFMGNQFHVPIHHPGWALMTTTVEPYLGEFGNSGPRYSTNGRVTWKGVQPAMTLAEANKYTVNSLIPGADAWFRSLGVPYIAGV